MLKKKHILMFLLLVVIFFIPNISNADEVEVTRDVYSNNGSMKFYFTGLSLDTTHEYEFGLGKTAASEIQNWHLITEYTETTATINITTTTSDLRNVINQVDTGYISIKDTSNDEIVLEPFAVDLKTPYLKLTNFTVIQNGKTFDNGDNNIQIALRCASNSQPFYQYEKITDQNIINKYKEIKENDGDIFELENMLSTTTPKSDWIRWDYWNGFDSFNGMNGFGHTENTISVPDTGLYYMWIYISGNNLKDMYGYILVDNLQPDVALESISLPKTANVALGSSLTLTPTFTPSTATNKIVTWSSSDESVATVDNAGRVTPKKVGSTIITVVSQDGNKRATCTVTVTSASNNNGNNNNNSGSGIINNDGKDDPTTAPGKLPQTGATIALAVTISVIVIAGIIALIRYSRFRDIK